MYRFGIVKNSFIFNNTEPIHNVLLKLSLVFQWYKNYKLYNNKYSITRTYVVNRSVLILVSFQKPRSAHQHSCLPRAVDANAIFSFVMVGRDAVLWSYDHSKCDARCFKLSRRSFRID